VQVRCARSRWKVNVGSVVLQQDQTYARGGAGVPANVNVGSVLP